MNYFRKLLSICRLLIMNFFSKSITINPIHSNVLMSAEVKAANGGTIRGKKIDHNGKLSLLATGGKLEIKSAYFNRYDIVSCRKRVIIGDGCILGPNVCIFDHNHKFGADGCISGYTYGDVIIGDNVWIGANCVILKNTHIGNNCVIGAGCVVQGDIPDNSLVMMDRELIIRQLRD